MSEPFVSKVRLWIGRMRGMLPFASGVLAALLALFLYNFLFPANQMTEGEVNDAISNALASATPRPPDSIRVYQVIAPSLVWVEAEIERETAEAGKGLGAGVIIDELGNILTSLHVVDKARKISVSFPDGSQSDAFVLTAQPEKDIAVLRAFNTPQIVIPATIGGSNGMRVGEEVFVVGHPYGLFNSMSAGVVSGFERTFETPNGGPTIEGLIQVDAAINPGNSGGPLLDRYGHVVGIIIGIVNPTNEDFFVGIGFAVPIDIAAGAVGLPPY